MGGGWAGGSTVRLFLHTNFFKNKQLAVILTGTHTHYNIHTYLHVGMWESETEKYTQPNMNKKNNTHKLTTDHKYG